LLYIPYKKNINNCTISKETIIIKKRKKKSKKKRERYIITYMMKVIPETLRNTKLDSNVFIKKGDNKLMAIIS
jgi:hypothetical protein